MWKGLLGLALLSGSVAFAAEWSTGADGAGPSYTADGLLRLPQDYREWVYLSSGMDMSYSDLPNTMGHSMFDNVFAGREAYQSFLRTGTWPDGTQLVLENRMATEQGSINKKGKFQSERVMGVEIHVKDVKRFQGGWAFFVFRSGATAKMTPMSADCYSCHQQHAAVDTTFVQFYPTLLGVARAKGTLLPR
jgi:hypothetical protein